ncbi:hypothetical protein [Burkholderia sp. Ac-20349]|uniref:hypothetical protein n=1 Tax=Burkholderia sp. Ac-20349 TaxID=2703893 RepID=UPI00197C17B1|nr:hypothetical protein [Burkholderia sp. Ac-20349]MBN3839320.1 hypothetical protein [Burkholderia sp. Ac-20349]
MMRPGGLRHELEGLNRNIARTDATLARLASDFWANDGICCPSCGVQGYSELELKQERRERRRGEILAKLKQGAPDAG